MKPVVVPIDGILDLHTFAPGEMDNLLHDYIDACLESAVYDLRIIHGKGKGVMRARVRSLLEKDRRVESMGDAPCDAGGWGATVVKLKGHEMSAKGRILVVDNESDQLMMMQEILERIGYGAKTAESPQEALEMIQKEAFSTVFMDLIMPDIDGTELCEKIKGVRPGVRVIAFSGHTHLYRPEQLERAGFDGSIRKPATIEEIRSALEPV